VVKKLSGHHPRHFIASLRQGSITACNNQHKANVLATHFQSVSSTSNYELAFCRTMLSLDVETHKAASEITPKDPRLNQLFSIGGYNAPYGVPKTLRQVLIKSAIN